MCKEIAPISMCVRDDGNDGPPAVCVTGPSTPHTRHNHPTTLQTGATVCKPQSPACGACPVQQHCLSYRLGACVRLRFLMYVCVSIYASNYRPPPYVHLYIHTFSYKHTYTHTPPPQPNIPRPRPRPAKHQRPRKCKKRRQQAPQSAAPSVRSHPSPHSPSRPPRCCR